MTQLMSITPDPPVHGQTATLCYEGTLPATISASYDPSPPGGGDATGIVLSTRCTTINVPSNASSVIFHDESGASDDLSRVVA